MLIMKNLRILLAFLALILLLAGLELFAPATDNGPSLNSSQICEKNKGRDDPWDPGEESVSIDSADAVIASADFSFSVDAAGIQDICRAGRKDDDPWDPGDESGDKPGVRHA